MNKQKSPPKLLAIVGPTATGKSDFAIDLAQKLNGEIVSADSRLIYKDFDIAVAKPTISERQAIKHHMIDVASPDENYTSAQYKDAAQTVINTIKANGKTPIIAGGTGLYIQLLFDGMDIPKVSPNYEFRAELEEFAEKNGVEALHKKLEKVDPVSAEKIHPNNTVRVIRALEVFNSLEVPYSEAKQKTEVENVHYIGLTAENRDFLYERIHKRVDVMLKNGIIEETEFLLKKYGKTQAITKTLGYRELIEYIEGRMTKDEAIELLKQKTRNFAKRQMTWFRRNKKIEWLYIDNENIKTHPFRV